MSDIVEQLRCRNLGKGVIEQRAADEIVRLRKYLHRTEKQALMWRNLMRSVGPDEATRLCALARVAEVVEETRDDRVRKFAEILTGYARWSVEDPDGINWRELLGYASQALARQYPDLEADVRDRAKELAGEDADVLDLLAWAALDTTLAELGAQ